MSPNPFTTFEEEKQSLDVPLKKLHLKICQIRRKVPFRSLFFSKVQAPSEVFHCEFYVSFKNAFIIEHPLTAASTLLRSSI